ncbi:MAG: RAMP superfamily CRISPR-associated protein [Bacillota bacterium]
MGWLHYRITFRLLSPLHVGHRKAGNLMQTRRYVPGKSLWGALTARLTQDAGSGFKPEAYEAVGRVVQSCFRFGYLYPAYMETGAAGVPDAEELKPFFPWEKGRVPFDYLFLESHTGTAVDAGSRGALAGSLHETEFISPQTRPERDNPLSLPVYLTGDLWVKKTPGEVEKNLQEVPEALRGVAVKAFAEWGSGLDKLQLGGEQKYGWGMVRLVAKKETEKLIHPGWQWVKSEDGEVVLAAVEDDAPLLAHALATEVGSGRQLIPVRGSVEPVVGRETRQDGFGASLSPALICWEPGGKVRRNQKMRVEGNGIWRPV